MKAFIAQMIFYLSMDNLDAMNGYLSSFGWCGTLVSLSLMAIESILIPLPYNTLVKSNELVFGGFFGLLISWTGILIGATLCFYISRLILGNLFKLLGRQIKSEPVKLKQLDRFLSNNSGKIVLVLRLIPLAPFDLVSYLYGATSARYRDFIIATAIGSIPILLACSF
ncbi:MAG: VTT domain-containing protein [Clostridioides sp.]|jgi:uncharacterized membrane protein YdjX (TVP38/TMEM64 family)|nr:VTT domain-containing protein [Clostridioides sp.]